MGVYTLKKSLRISAERFLRLLVAVVDVARYSNHVNCKMLLCFVYDPQNRVRNSRGLETDLSKLSSDGMLVKVFIRP